jgi:hypothetical protein
MAAILIPTSSGERPDHRDESGRVERPLLRVIDGGHSPHRLAVTYRRRRLAALATVVVLIVGALAAGRAALAAVTPSPPASPPATATSSGPGAPAGPVVVVRPGDTLWSIARRASPEGDVRAVVDRLAAAHGPGPLEVGEVMPIGPPGG